MSVDAFRAKFLKKPSPKLEAVTAPELVGPPAPYDLYLQWLALMHESPRLDAFKFKHLLPDIRERVLVTVRDQMLGKVWEREHLQELAESEAALSALQDELDHAGLSDRLGAW